ncbi:uncharacterized protein BDW43DRAFT_304708 [Aspergillus alliaceus]|uniref:uncharacterized protein n=1 Tax=Petromyces alliaceus TaxID=209559 RepID=UPI0012A5D55F|nr:uncharacterized protein BDW43DRAFT_304708 [Aspergillus alliaceus]KAB8227307.1 hypothetical protein BDW43DRAFT_304708 [Aspergillus alliaceus]
MDSCASNLSSEKYGYDFVVATTRASNNSELNYPVTGYVTKSITLPELLNLTHQVNPFDIPADTPWSDPRIQALRKVYFAVGVGIQMGLPPCLEESANSVTFNIFYSQITVVQLQPPGWGPNGTWNAWGQEDGDPWHILSLQQLLFDLDNAVLQSGSTFKGVPPHCPAWNVLQDNFISIYSTHVKKHGLPLVSVTAVSLSADESQLNMTAFERQVSPLKGYNGERIQDPPTLSKSATALDYLCAANGHSLPGYQQH